MAKASGLILHRPTAVQMAGWTAAAQTSHAEILQNIGGRAPEMYQRIQDMRVKYAAQ